jgi:nitrogen fixation NifU-like protein
LKSESEGHQGADLTKKRIEQKRDWPYIMDTEQLYQDRILAFARTARKPPNLGAFDLGPLNLNLGDFTASVNNPSCGDKVEMGLNLDKNNRISTINAAAQGCVLCEAATGLLLTALVGHHKDDLPRLEAAIKTWLNGDHDDLALEGQDAFMPVRAFTSRHLCVRLPFQAAAKAVMS